MSENIKTIIVTAHDTEDNWNQAAAAGFIPSKGQQIIYEADDTHSYIRLKIGDGKTNIKQLPFFIEEPAEVVATNTLNKLLGDKTEEGFILLDGGRVTLKSN